MFLSVGFSSHAVLVTEVRACVWSGRLFSLLLPVMFGDEIYGVPVFRTPGLAFGNMLPGGAGCSTWLLRC